MIISIAGPTASGKTALSLEVAEKLGGPERVEIVSADAMQLYRGMDIGTAKLPVSERRGIVHHQIDVLDIAHEASVAAYQRHARADVESILARGKTALVVGGSGLYLAALLDELDFPGHDPTIRAELESIAASHGLEPLVRELAEKDPQSHATIDLANPRRVIRALEVIRLTGGLFTPRFPRHTSHYGEHIAFATTRGNEILSEAISQRARTMMDQGLLEETRSLLDRGLRQTPTASRATGYAQAIAVLDGLMSQEDAVDAIAQSTRRLAKKQRTWLRADPRSRWLDLSDGDLAGTADQIVTVARGDSALQ